MLQLVRGRTCYSWLEVGRGRGRSGDDLVADRVVAPFWSVGVRCFACFIEFFGFGTPF
jgi:hypothetical protein